MKCSGSESGRSPQLPQSSRKSSDGPVAHIRPGELAAGNWRVRRNRDRTSRSACLSLQPTLYSSFGPSWMQLRHPSSDGVIRSFSDVLTDRYYMGTLSSSTADRSAMRSHRSKLQLCILLPLLAFALILGGGLPCVAQATAGGDSWRQFREHHPDGRQPGNCSVCGQVGVLSQ